MRKDLQARNSGSLVKDIAWGEQRDVFSDRLGRSAIRAYFANPDDPLVRSLIESLIHPARMDEMFGRSCPFREPRLQNGDAVLGKNMRGENIRYSTNGLGAGELVAGNTGSSKTNFIKSQILQLAPKLNGLWCSDIYKKELRHLRPLLRQAGVDLVIMRPPAFRLNPLQADGGDLQTHLADTMDLLDRILHIPGRGMAILRTVAHHLYREFNVYAGAKDRWPTFYDLYERIHDTPNLNAAAKDSLLDRLGALLTSLTPQVAAYRLAWRPSDLSRHHIVFELSSAGEQVKTLLLGNCLFSVLRSRIDEGRVNTDMDFWCVFEDAQRFFTAKPDEGRDLAPAEELAGLIRGTGTGLAFTVQSMAGLPPGLLANMSSKVMFRLGTHRDYQALSADMGMTPEQTQWAKLNLRPGAMIAQFAEGPSRLPFVAHVPRLDVPATVTDAEAEASVGALRNLPVVPAKEFARWTPRHLVDLTGTSVEEPSVLTAVEMAFLAAVISHPGKPSSAYARLTKTAGKRAAEIRKRLVQQGYLREHEVATSGRGRNAIILEPLEPAREAVAAREGATP